MKKFEELFDKEVLKKYSYRIDSEIKNEFEHMIFEYLDGADREDWERVIHFSSKEFKRPRVHNENEYKEELATICSRLKNKEDSQIMDYLSELLIDILGGGLVEKFNEILKENYFDFALQYDKSSPWILRSTLEEQEKMEEVKPKDVVKAPRIIIKDEEINISKSDGIVFDKTIFISYCWKNEKDVDSIDTYFSKNGIELKRDKRELEYKQSIKEFMKTIRQADYVIQVISDDYLKSENCMYEVLELLKDDDYKNKILPIIIDNTEIYGNNKIKYIEFWNDEMNKLEEIIKGLKPETAIPQYKQKIRIQNIQTNIMEFIDVITDMMHYSLTTLTNSNFREVFDYLGISEIVKNKYEKSIKSKPYGTIIYNLDRIMKNAIELKNDYQNDKIEYMELSQKTEQEFRPQLVNINKELQGTPLVDIEKHTIVDNLISMTTQLINSLQSLKFDKEGLAVNIAENFYKEQRKMIYPI